MNQPSGEPFDTSVEGHSGSWPEPPAKWSFSSLDEVESCARRYSLGRATYSGIWEESGYPEPPVLARITGNVVHDCLEQIQNGINSAPATLPRSERVVTALQSFGGYSAVISAAVEKEVSKLRTNPRSWDQASSIESELLHKVSEMRLDIQIRLSRVPDLPTVPGALVEPTDAVLVEPTDGLRTSALALGPNPEVWLEAPSLRLVGKADLIVVKEESCEIRDHKTGEPKAEYEDQLRLYALLWSKDSNKNPRGIPAARLVVEYREREQVFDSPSDEDLERLESVVADRVSRADAEVTTRPPEARPSPECVEKRCPVRHLCDEYWASEFSRPGSESGFYDLELTEAVESGPRSWLMRSVHFTEPLLVRVKSPTQADAISESSDRGVRALNVRITESEEGPTTVGLTRFSEVWPLVSSPTS